MSTHVLLLQAAGARNAIMATAARMTPALCCACKWLLLTLVAVAASWVAAELAPGGEVLLCSGTVANPQLLMLSGIGPAAQLSDAGVQVLVDAPGVGANLQDHPATLWAAK